MLFVIISLPVSTAVVLYSLSTLPIAMAWPRTLSDLAQIGRDLHGYSQSGPWPLAHVIAVMAISAVWKHAWSIPGSVLWVSFLVSLLDLFPALADPQPSECARRRSLLTRIRDHHAHHSHHHRFNMCNHPCSASSSLPHLHVSTRPRYDAQRARGRLLGPRER